MRYISAMMMMWLFCGGILAQKHGKETVIIETAYGSMTIKLFEETPLHKENFLKLARQGYYDSLLFHRVINEFMIQGGDHLSKKAGQGDSLGHGDLGYMVKAEFHPGIIHKKGRLCAARESDDINPERSSSATQFYIVMGKRRTAEDLRKYEERINSTNLKLQRHRYLSSPEGRTDRQTRDRLKAENKKDSLTFFESKLDERLSGSVKPFSFSDLQRSTYLNEPGTPHLDGSYTVFGEVTVGLDVIDRIAAVKTDERDRPLEDIRMKVRVIE